MQDGQTRKFKIDKTKKKNCKLPGEKIVEIEIKKGNDFFTMVNAENQVYVQCEAGYVPSLIVRGKAEQCGIGKILMQLCLDEADKHNVEGWNEDNMALNKIDEYIEDCQQAACKNNRFTDLKTWIVNQCSKLLYLEMQTTPKSAAHVYFNSAIASGFREMFMVHNMVTDWVNGYPEFYPKDGPCSVKTLKKRYNDNGNMYDGG